MSDLSCRGKTFEVMAQHGDTVYVFFFTWWCYVVLGVFEYLRVMECNVVVVYQADERIMVFVTLEVSIHPLAMWCSHGEGNIKETHIDI